jgi:hypothetical protein
MDALVEKAQIVRRETATRIVLVVGRANGGNVMTLRSSSLLVAAVALLGASAADAKGGRVIFNGCVKQKVMKGALCTYVGNYALAGSSQPDPFKGLGVGGNGIRNPIVTVCGGIGLTHVEWHYNKMKCPKPMKGKKD